MWIKSSGGKLLNAKNFRAFEVKRAENMRTVPHGNGKYTIYKDCPKSGFVVVAWVSGGLHFLTDGLPESRAHEVLTAIYAALQDGAKTFTVSQFTEGA